MAQLYYTTKALEQMEDEKSTNTGNTKESIPELQSSEYPNLKSKAK